MIVYLIGFMGSGKSTFGRRMASRAGWQFADLDSLIEDEEGKTVEAIFSEDGEEYFREIESACLKKIPQEGNMILACGGGTPCFLDNMDYMNGTGITVYIKSDVKTLKNRLINAKKTRPLIKDMDPGNLEKYIGDKLTEREVCYNKAQLIIDGLRADPGKIMDIILSSRT